MFWRDQFAGKPFIDVFKVWEGGLVYYGGLIGASLACIAYAYAKRLPLWKTADVMAPSVALGQMFGRLGCLLNGCCYGRATTCAWGIRYPSGHETHPEGGLALTVHPTQVYESLLALGLYLGLAWWFRRKRFDGQVFAFYLVGYAIIRSTVEMFRGDYPPQQVLSGWATPAHVVSGLILAIGLVLLLRLPKTRGIPTT
jgi:phosphatidylglycerol:prolipoprotein diacylglycerol transferase